MAQRRGALVKMTLTLILTFALISFVQALECGLNSTVKTDLDVVLNTCMYKGRSSTAVEKVGNKPNSSDYDSGDYGEESFYYFDSISEETPNKTSRRSDKLKDHQDSAVTEVDRSISPIDIERCRFHCIFKKLKIVDDEGFPNHDKLSEELIGNIQNYELRDFFQDSVDECFQLTQQADDLDICDFSLNFFRCLAEKGKANCADWPIGDATFSDMF